MASWKHEAPPGDDRRAGSVREVPRCHEGDSDGPQKRDAAKPVQEVETQEETNHGENTHPLKTAPYPPVNGIGVTHAQWMNRTKK